MRIVRYYPRALVGDGGMTSAVRNWSQAMARCGAEAVIAYDAGVSPPDDESVEWVQVRHAGRRGLKFPLGLENVLEGTDLLVLHSGRSLAGTGSGAGVGSRTGTGLMTGSTSMTSIVSPMSTATFPVWTAGLLRASLSQGDLLDSD